MSTSPSNVRHHQAVSSVSGLPEPQWATAAEIGAGGLGLASQPVPRKKWTRTTKAQKLGQPAFVYLFVHAHEQCVKVGVSLEPLQRLNQLPECADISVGQSWVVPMPDARRAYEVERVRHKALAPSVFQIRSRGVYDGKTEWFKLDALPVAIRLLQSVPCAGRGGGTFTPMPLSSMLPHASGTVGAGGALGDEDWSAACAEQHNLRVAGEVCQGLLFVADHLPVRLSAHKPRAQPDVVFKGFRQWGSDVRAFQRPSIEVWRERAAVVDLDTYGLQRGKTSAEVLLEAHPCLAAMLGYDRLEPDSLCIRLADTEHLRALLAGDAMCAHLKALMAQLELICAQAGFSQLALRNA